MSQVAVEPRELITPALNQKEKLPHYVDAAIDFIGGTAGGIANVYVGQPLDTVKVKLQTFPTYYKNAWHCFKQTYTKEGIARGLYAGTGPALMANIAENAVLFAAYGQCQKLVAFGVGKSGKVDDLNVVENALSGSCAAVFSSIVLCPTELVKCRLQAMREMAVTGLSEKQRIGPYQLTRQILQEEGYRGLFKGLSATFAREVPGYFFFFGGYEITKAFLTPPGKTKDDVGPLGTVLAGGVGGVSLWIAVFPTDVVKSRIQVQCVGKGATPPFFGTLIKIFKEEGIGALYRGLGPNLLRTFPSTGALFLAYEVTKRNLTNLASS